jgi:hypothetical protein
MQSALAVVTPRQLAAACLVALACTQELNFVPTLRSFKFRAGPGTQLQDTPQGRAAAL